MALHDTSTKQEQQAQNDLAIKLALERELIIKLRKFFTKMASKLKNLYAETRIILDTTEFNEELNQLIFNQYKNTSNKFQNQLLNHEDVSDEIRKDKELLSRINTGIEHYNLYHVKKSVTEINKTNQKQVNKSIKDVLIASAVGGLALSKTDIAQKASIAFKSIAFARTNTIAMTETQKSAEGTKNIEAYNLDKKKQDKTPMNKTWVAVLDEKTRLSHAEADGQTVTINEPFIVQEQKLMFPGDFSLGATADNTINCRCSSVYHTEGEDIE